MATTAFISHNKAQKDLAREIAIHLVASSVNVWFDEWNIALGDSITAEINNGLAGCTHFVIVWSKEAAVAPWVNQEFEAAIAMMASSGCPRLIILKLDATPLPAPVGQLNYLPFSENPGPADMSLLVSAITGNSGNTNLLRAIARKHGELLYFDENVAPVELPACPHCGGSIYTFTSTDERRDETYHVAKCRDCNWNDH